MHDQVSFDLEAGEQFATALQPRHEQLANSIRVHDLEADIVSFIEGDLSSLVAYLTQVEADYTFVRHVVEGFGAAPTMIVDHATGQVISVPNIDGQPDTSGLTNAERALFEEHLALNPDAPAILWRGGNDPGGTYSIEHRTGFTADGSGDLARGRHALTTMLDFTGDSTQLAEDEFGLVDHGNGHYTVVLPGVTDLSSPNIGYNDRHRSVRDLDQEAAASNIFNGVDHNGYAQMVRHWIQDQIDAEAIPLGANIMLVGHSFGGDTAVDLASDPQFNGEMVNVTHVVSAGYASEHQLGSIPDGTEVLVLQNIYDVPTLAESVPSALWGDEEELARTVGRIGVEGAEDTAGAAGRGINALGGLVEDGIATFPGSPSVELPDLPTHVTWVDDNRRGPDGELITEFDGGYGSLWNPEDGVRVGHGQEAYTGYLNGDGLENAELDDFLTSIGSDGYSQSGDAIAIDVSVPE